MATNIPPHNLGELIDACCALIDNPELTVPQLMEYVPGPDFPTGGSILGRNGIRAGYELGRGSLIMRAKTRIEEARGGRESIIVSEIPYQENKARLHERIAEVVRDKRVEGIAEVRDESDRDGVRLVIELKRDAMADVVLNQLYRFTPLQTSFGVNALALDGGRPRLMSLKELLEAFIRFRAEVITRRTKFELNHARDRAHVLVGLAIAVANIDEVIEMIRRAPDPVVARERLMARDWPAMDVTPLIALDRRAWAGSRRRRHLQALRGTGPRHPRAAPAAPDRPRTRQDRRGTGRGRPDDRPAISSCWAIATSCSR